jgi:two-component system OmpR family sensor kinase
VLLRESVSQLMVLADARCVDVGFEGSMAAVVFAPAAELRSVFDNLIDNALRYAPEGGVVDVRLHLFEGHAVVDVLDNGPGIPQAAMGRVFDRFFRVPGSAADWGWPLRAQPPSGMACASSCATAAMAGG